MQLAQIVDNIVTNIITVNDLDIPDFCTGWPDATHLSMGQTYDADAVAALVLEDNKSLVRSERNKKLMETDWTSASDLTMSSDMTTYRQALRDIPTQAGFPTSITWPTKP